MHIVVTTDVAAALIRLICKMHLSFRLDKRPGESHLALDGKKTIYAEGLFKAFGINFAAEGSKAPPFSKEFKTLGLLIDTSQASDKAVYLGHTEKRSLELLASINEVLEQQVTSDYEDAGTIAWQSCLVSHIYFWKKVECGQ